MGRVYTIEDTQTTYASNGTAIELNTAATHIIKILAAFLGQTTLAGDSNAGMQQVSISRFTASGSGGNTTGVGVQAHDGGDAAHGLTQIDSFHTTKGAGESIIINESMNIQAGWYYAPIPEEMINAGPSEFIGSAFQAVPTSATWVARMTIEIIAG